MFSKDAVVIKDEGVTLNESHQIALSVPFNKAVCPVLEIYLFKHTWNRKVLFACGNLNMASSLGWFYGEEDEYDYRVRWRALFRIGKGEVEHDDIEKPQRLKYPTSRPENKLLYLDDLIYKLPRGDTLKTKKAQKKYLDQSRQESRQATQRTSAIQNEVKRLKLSGDITEPMPEENKSTQTPANESDMLYEADYRLYNKFKRITEMLDDEDLNELTNEEKIQIVADLHSKGQLVALGIIEEEEDNSPLKQPEKNILADRLESKTWQRSVMNPCSPSRMLDSPFTHQRSEKGRSSHISAESLSIGRRLRDKESEEDQGSERVIRKLDLRDDDEIESLQAEISDKNMNYNDLFVPVPPEANKHEAKFIEEKTQKSTFPLFKLSQGFNIFSKRKEMEEYIDYVGYYDFLGCR